MKVKIVIVGIGGFGKNYVRSLLDCEETRSYTIVGVVDPFPEAAPDYERIIRAGIPVFADLEQFYNSLEADLAIICSPIHYHCPQTKIALSRGSNVLCEKPMCASVDEALEMIRARDESGKFVAIGFQWSFSPIIHELKKDIRSGLFGKPVRFKTLALYPRSDKYFNRGWAGKVRDSKGNLILDSIANNATAHFIHNMFYVLGDTPDSSVTPISVKAELYRANSIENYDTATMCCMTTDGTELLYLGSHAVKGKSGQVYFSYEFEKAVVTYGDHPDNNIIAKFQNGAEKHYGNPNEDGMRKLWQTIEAVWTGNPLPCGLESSLSHTVCINGMQESMPAISEFPSTMVKRGEFPDNHQGNYADGLEEAFKDCFNLNKLPHEAGYEWATAGSIVDLREYFLKR